MRNPRTGEWTGDVREELCEQIIATLHNRQISYEEGFEENGENLLTMSGDELDYISERLYQCDHCGFWLDAQADPPNEVDGETICGDCLDMEVHQD